MTKKTTTNHKGRPVVITTKHRGVFFGYAEDTSGDSVKLTGCRCAIKWGTTEGWLQLAETGPTSDSKIGARADIDLRDVTAVAEVTEEAREAWERA